jgi:hypothetical protein
MRAAESGGLAHRRHLRFEGLPVVDEHGDLRRPGHCLAQHVQPLRVERGQQHVHASEVATRPRVARDDAGFHQVGAAPPGHADRHFARGLRGRADRQGRHGDDDLELCRDEFLCQWKGPFALFIAIADVEADVPALEPAQFAQAFVDRWPHASSAAEPTNAANALGGLRSAPRRVFMPSSLSRDWTPEYGAGAEVQVRKAAAAPDARVYSMT